MNNFRAHRSILVGPMIKYLISISIKTESINFSRISNLIKRVALITSMIRFKRIVWKASHTLCHLFSFFYKTAVVYQRNGSRQMSFLFTQKDSKDDIKNYRPISLTCLVMKLFERILKEELLLSYADSK